MRANEENESTRTAAICLERCHQPGGLHRDWEVGMSDDEVFVRRGTDD